MCKLCVFLFLFFLARMSLLLQERVLFVLFKCVSVCVLGLRLGVKVCRGQPEASGCTIRAADDVGGGGQAAVNHLTDEA